MTTDPAQARVQRPRRPRGAGTVRDMVVSLAVLAAVVVGYLLVSGLWRNVVLRAGRPVTPTVDVRAIATSAASTAPFPLVAPSGLPAGWTGQAAQLEPGDVWHVAETTPHSAFAGVDETSAPGTAVLDAHLPDRRPAGSVELASGRWDRYTAGRTDGSTGPGLVQRRGATVVVVSGTADAGELATLAASLTTVR